MDLTKLLRIGALALLPVLASTADAQAPAEEPVAAEMVSQGRLTLPDGGQVSAPDGSWEWRELRDVPVKTFILAKDQARIIVMHQHVKQVNDEFMRGFVDGTLRGSAKQGIKVLEPRYAPSDFPVSGSYRFEATTVLPNGVSFTRAGYVLPTGYLVLMSYQGSTEPPELRKVAASVTPQAKP